MNVNGTSVPKGNHSRCKHPSVYRRLIARFDFLGTGVANAIEKGGLLLQKVANTVRFEWFWKQYVTGQPGVVILESFDSSRTKRPIWNIAIEKVLELSNDGMILEFGCNNGGSLLYFASHVPPTIKLVGFDCFQGLPEAWDNLPRGAIKGFGAPLELWNDYPNEKEKVLQTFQATGVLPPAPQKNVSIEVGLFSEAVPRFLRNGLHLNISLIHFDADIYISTRPVLDSIAGQIKTPYFILFDEFYSVNHEFRAWMEFVETFGLSRWRVVAASEDGAQMLLEVNCD